MANSAKSSVRTGLLHRLLGVFLLCLALGGNVVHAGSDREAPDEAAEIETAVAQASWSIQRMASEDPAAFAAVLEQAFGARLDPDARRDLVQQAAEGRLPLPERILFLPSDTLRGADGAYATENGGVIFLNTAIRLDPAALPEVMIHEWVHHLDATLGAGDAPGDEGEIFLEGYKNYGPISDAQLNRLRASESGHASIIFEGRVVEVELFWGWIKKAVKSVGKFVGKVAKAAVDTVVDTVEAVGKAGVSALTVVGSVGATVIQGAAAGIAKVVGADKLAAELADGALDTLKKAGESAVNVATAAGDLYNQASLNLDSTGLPLGTIAGIGLSLTPAGPFVAVAKGVADVTSAIKNKGDVLGAVGFAALDIGFNSMGRINRGVRAGKAAGAAAGTAKKAVQKAADPSTWQKVTGYIGSTRLGKFGKAVADKAKIAGKKVQDSAFGKYGKKKLDEIGNYGKKKVNEYNKFMDEGYLSKASGLEKTIGARLTDSKTWDTLKYFRYLNTGVQPKWFIPGRERDKETGELLGRGRSVWARIGDGAGEYGPESFETIKDIVEIVSGPAHLMSGPAHLVSVAKLVVDTVGTTGTATGGNTSAGTTGTDPGGDTAGGTTDTDPGGNTAGGTTGTVAGGSNPGGATGTVAGGNSTGGTTATVAGGNSSGGTTGTAAGGNTSGGTTGTVAGGSNPGGATGTVAGGNTSGGTTATVAGGSNPGGTTGTVAGGNNPGGTTGTAAGGNNPGGTTGTAAGGNNPGGTTGTVAGGSTPGGTTGTVAGGNSSGGTTGTVAGGSTPGGATGTVAGGNGSGGATGTVAGGNSSGGTTDPGDDWGDEPGGSTSTVMAGNNSGGSTGPGGDWGDEPGGSTSTVMAGNNSGGSTGPGGDGVDGWGDDPGGTTSTVMGGNTPGGTTDPGDGWGDEPGGTTSTVMGGNNSGGTTDPGDGWGDEPGGSTSTVMAGNNSGGSTDPGDGWGEDPGGSTSTVMAGNNSGGSTDPGDGWGDDPGGTSSTVIAGGGTTDPGEGWGTGGGGQQQPAQVGSGTGEFNNAPATFAFWGQREQLSLMRIQVGGGGIWEMTFNGPPDGNGIFHGQMSPCTGGNCPCEFFEEGQNYYIGSCDDSNSADGNRFSLRLD